MIFCHLFFSCCFGLEIISVYCFFSVSTRESVTRIQDRQNKFDSSPTINKVDCVKQITFHICSDVELYFLFYIILFFFHKRNAILQADSRKDCEEVMKQHLRFFGFRYMSRISNYRSAVFFFSLAVDCNNKQHLEEDLSQWKAWGKHQLQITQSSLCFFDTVAIA